MPRKRPTARLYTEISIKSPSTPTSTAQQAIDHISQISRLLKLENKPDLEKYMRENDLLLQLTWRCRCKNNRNWRCNNATDKRGTQCKACGDARRARERLQWAQRMVRDSRTKDDKPKTNKKKRKRVSAEQRIVSDSQYKDRKKVKYPKVLITLMYLI